MTSNVAEDDDPLLTTPMPRYNAMLAILRNTLYMLVHHYFAVIVADVWQIRRNI